MDRSWLYVLAISALLVHFIAADLVALNDEFVRMKNDLPMNTIKDVVAKQTEMFEAIATYLDIEEHLPSDGSLPEKLPPVMSRKSHLQHQHDADHLDIHTDVVFVGFPAAAVDAVRSKWFEPLSHTDPLMATVGEASNVVAVPGDVNIHHHFHLVQISFHVADALRDYMTKLLLHQSGDEGNPYYINAWEMEELLDDLAMKIGATHTMKLTGTKEKSLKVSSDATLFIFNLKLASITGDEVEYTYRNGFSLRDLKEMAADKTLLSLAKSVLDVKRPSRMIFSSSEKTTLFSRDTLDSKYNERVYVRSDTSKNQQVHWRDAVAATRDWANELTAKIEPLSKKFQLSDRATRILKADPNTSLGRNRMSLAAAIVQASKLDAKEDEKDCSHCSATTWVGSDRVMWRDLHAIAAPPVHISMGHSPSEPLPRPLTESEWLKLGAATILTNPLQKKATSSVEEDMTTLQNAIKRQLGTLDTLLWQSDCPKFETADFLWHPAPIHGDNAGDHLNTVGEAIVSAALRRTMSLACSSLLFQVALLNTTAQLSEESVKLSGAYKESGDASTARYINEFNILQVKILADVLEISNPLLADAAATSQLHASAISEEAAVYLGHLTSYVLRTARYRISPPMALRIDPTKGTHESHHADWKTRGISTISLSPITEGMRRRTEQMEHDVISARVSEEEMSSGMISRAAHAYTGESLLEVVLSDGIFRHNNDRAIVSGLVARKEHLLAEEARDLPVWNTLLPQVLFPAKIDIVVYIIKLHSAYEPMAPAVGDTSGFDYATFMNEASRLKLPNQQMTITTQVIDKKTIAGEHGLGLAISGCRRVGVVPSPKRFKKHMGTEFYKFFDTTCLWSHLHEVDDHGVVHNIHDTKIDKSASQTQHIPVFFISMHSSDAVFLENLQLATVVGNSVVIVQNKQDKVLSDLTCVHHPVHAPLDSARAHTSLREVSGLNPVNSALAALAQAIGGLAIGHSGHRGLPTAPSLGAALSGDPEQFEKKHEESNMLWSMAEIGLDRHSWMNGARKDFLDALINVEAPGFLLRDWSSYLGESPMFEAATLSSHYLPRFSTLELDFIHRSRVLRSVGQTRATVRGITHSLIGQPSEKLEKDLKEVERLTVQALAAGDVTDWVAAASFANAAFLKAQEVHALHHDDVHDLVVKAAIYSVDRIEQHGKTHIIEKVRANMVQEIDNNDEDSFWVYYLKNVVVFVITTYASFLAMHNFIKWRKKKMILKY